MYQHYWRPWDEALRDIWVREMPEGVMKAEDFTFFHDNMWDYEFQLRFAAWLHEKKKAVRTACLVGIRTQESYNRWRTIYGGLKQQLYHNYQWSSKIANDVFNLYPIYDWKTTDIWTANGKFGWDYNRLYDLYYYAGVSLERQRVASPFISEAIESLHLYKAIEPDTWGRMIGTGLISRLFMAVHMRWGMVQSSCRKGILGNRLWSFCFLHFQRKPAGDI